MIDQFFRLTATSPIIYIGPLIDRNESEKKQDLRDQKQPELILFHPT